MDDQQIRINKFFSEAGVLSRRKADEALAEGRIFLNGVPARPGDKVNPEKDTVTLDGKIIQTRKRGVVLAYYKPIGLVTTSREADPKSIFRYLDYPETLLYVGRLDQSSQGLLLLTDDGDLANQIQKAGNRHEKEYVVRVDQDLTQNFLNRIQKGGLTFEDLGNRPTAPCRVFPQGKRTFRIILTEGMNREIRRMTEAFGYRVVYLKRIRVMNITLGDLKPGEYRKLSEGEVKELRRLCGHAGK